MQDGKFTYFSSIVSIHRRLIVEQKQRKKLLLLSIYEFSIYIDFSLNKNGNRLNLGRNGNIRHFFLDNIAEKLWKIVCFHTN